MTPIAQRAEPAAAWLKWRPGRASLAAKLSVAFLGLVAFVLIVNGALDTYLTYGQAKRAALEVEGEKARAAAERVGVFLDEIQTQLGWTAGVEWGYAKPEQQRYDFIRLLRQAPAITALSYIDGKGREQLAVSRLEPDAVASGKDFSADPSFLRAVADKVWFGPVEFRRGSEPYMTVALAHVGKTPGVTVADVNLKLVWDVVSAIHVGDKGFAYVVDQKGRLIAHPDLSLVLRDTDFSQLPQVAAALAERGTSEAQVARSLDGSRVLTAHAVAPKTHWTVFVEQPLAEALASAYRSLLRSLALLGLGLALAAVSGVALARRMAAPIRLLQSGAERLGSGELTQRLDIRTGDEIEALAGGFNRMAERLQESYENLEGKVEARTHDLNEALARQTATSEILRVISKSPTDARPVFDSIVFSAARLLHCEMAFVMLVDGESWRNAAAATPEGLQPVVLADRFPVDPAQNFPSRAIVSKEMVSLPDWSKLELPEHQLRVQNLYGFQASLHLPFMREGECVGVLTLLSRRPHAFGDAEIAQSQAFRDQALIAMENARLFNETRESLAQQTATADVLKVISRSAFNLQTVLDTLTSSAATLCEAEKACIFLRRGEAFHWSSNYGFNQELVVYAEAHPFTPGGNSATARVARDGVVTHIPDVLSDPEYTAGEYQRLGNYRTMLGVPLWREGETIGVFIMTREAVRPFSPRQIELLQTFADQAVIAIENARLFEEVQARTRDLEHALERQTATSEILRVIAGAPGDADRALQFIAETCARLFAAPSVSIQLAEGVEFVREYRIGAIAQRIGSAYPRANIKVGGRNLPGAVVAEQRQIHIPDLDDLDPAMADFPGLPHARAGGARTVCGTPLRHEDHAIGALILFRNVLQPFTADELAMLQTFADQAVIAIENARLFAEVQARTRDLTEALQMQIATSDVLKVISRSAFDLDAVFSTLLTSAIQLSEASGGAICVREGDAYRYRSVEGTDLTPQFQQFLMDRIAPAERQSIAGRVILSGNVEQIYDVFEDAEYQIPTGALGNPSRAMIGVPMLREDRVEGVLVLIRSQPGHFSERQIGLLQTFADQAVIAVGNVRLFDEVQEALEQQKASAGVLSAIGRSVSDASPVFEEILSACQRLFGSHEMGIYTVDADEMVRVAAWRGERRAEVRHDVTPLADSVTGRIIAERRVHHIPDLLADPNLTPLVRERAQRLGSASLLYAPMLWEERGLGSILIVRSPPNPFTERETEMLRTFADQAAIAIQNTRLFDEVQSRTRELELSLSDLRKAQDRLVQSEKLAALGQLTAGIAHEIKNPLNFVNNFALLSRELLEELREALSQLPEGARADADELMGLIDSNLEKVASHGRRADSIVKNMLLHSREGSGERSRVSVNAMVEEAINLGYHGARAEKPGFNVTIEKSLDPNAGEADLYLQEITRVLLNLISNGFYASAKRRQSEGPGYEPKLSASTRALGDDVEIRIRDNGTGIPDEVRAKMFNPFFTTKPAGEGTGLGLSLSHDIVVKQHGGTLGVETEPGGFTEFIITLPREGARE